MTPRVSRRRMFVSALMASSLFAVTACTSAGSWLLYTSAAADGDSLVEFAVVAVSL